MTVLFRLEFIYRNVVNFHFINSFAEDELLVFYFTQYKYEIKSSEEV